MHIFVYNPTDIKDVINKGKYFLEEFFKSKERYCNVYGPSGVGKTLAITLLAKKYGYKIKRLTKVSERRYDSIDITGVPILYLITDERVFRKILKLPVGNNKVIYESFESVKHVNNIVKVKFSRLSDSVLSSINPVLSDEVVSKAKGNIRAILNESVIEKKKERNDLLYDFHRLKIPEFFYDITEDSFYGFAKFWDKVKSYGDLLCENG